jgi:hypothetical protein
MRHFCLWRLVAGIRIAINGRSTQGLKPTGFLELYAALKRRSSTVASGETG